MRSNELETYTKFDSYEGRTMPSFIQSFEITGNNETSIVFRGIVSQNIFERMIEGFEEVELVRTKYLFLKKAFKNRTKQLHYSQICCDLLDSGITEDEFDKEIEQNPNKYAITICNQPINISHLDILSSVVKELIEDKSLDNDITTDEVAELFDVCLDKVVEKIELLRLPE